VYYTINQMLKSSTPLQGMRVAGSFDTLSAKMGYTPKISFSIVLILTKAEIFTLTKAEIFTLTKAEILSLSVKYLIKRRCIIRKCIIRTFIVLNIYRPEHLSSRYIITCLSSERYIKTINALYISTEFFCLDEDMIIIVFAK
jgi:hypothetical protein